MKLNLQLFLGAGILLASATSWSLGLGDLKVFSTLNQALHAELEVIDLGVSSTDELVVSIASYETFEKYKIDRPRFYEEVTLTPVADQPQKGVLRYTVQSHSFIHEPYLHFIIEARWPGGKVQREYTALLGLPAPLP